MLIMVPHVQDEMLPPEHMLQLYNVLKAAGSKRVVWTEFPTGNHMETYELCRQEYWPAVRAFFEQNFASGAVHALVWTQLCRLKSANSLHVACRQPSSRCVPR